LKERTRRDRVSRARPAAKKINYERPKLALLTGRGTAKGFIECKSGSAAVSGCAMGGAD
jgi:hypothetical protein